MLNIFTANCTKELAEKVVKNINENRNNESAIFGDTFKLSDCPIEYFANKEITCQYRESIRDKKIYIFGGTGTHEIMETLLMIDAAKRASAKHICVVIPWYGYARQDKKEGARGPMGAKLVADIVSVAGANSIITIDLHADSIQGFFNVPVNHINGYSIFKNTLQNIVSQDKGSYLICSPDAGGTIRAKTFAKKFDIEMVVMNKERSKPGEIAKMSLVGDVSEKNIVIIDDMIDSAGTLCKASDYLITEKRAKSVIAIITHPVLTGKAVERISNSSISALYVSDTIPLNDDAKACSKIKVVSASDILGKIIGRVYVGESMNEVNS